MSISVLFYTENSEHLKQLKHDRSAGETFVSSYHFTKVTKT